MEAVYQSVNCLMQLAPPPQWIVERVDPEHWKQVESNLGTPLPRDYRLMLTISGTGIFNDLFYLFNPVAASESMNLMNQARRDLPEWSAHLQCYEETKSVFPDQCPYECFPAPEGLLPLGGDTNGGFAFWLTQGKPEEWLLIFYPHEFWTFQRYAMGLAEFLVRWLSGELPEAFDGAGASFFKRTDPIFQS